MSEVSAHGGHFTVRKTFWAVKNAFSLSDVWGAFAAADISLGRKSG
jgi:hypothetical protein